MAANSQMQVHHGLLRNANGDGAEHPQEYGAELDARDRGVVGRYGEGS